MTTDCTTCSSVVAGLSAYNPSKSSAFDATKEGIVFPPPGSDKTSELQITATAFTDAEVLAFPEFDRITVLNAPILSI